MRIPLVLLLQLITVVIFGTTHILALEFTLYFFHPWLDIPMHILGGIVIALSLFSLRTITTCVPERYLEFIPLLLIVLAVGLSWEVFEIWAGIPLLETDFEKDIVFDLIMDMVGGSIGWYVGSKVRYL